MTNELVVRCIMSKDIVPQSEAEQAIYALVDIKPKSRMGTGMMPANVSLVLDRSGSMEGEKLENMKEAAGYVVDHLSDTDFVSITIFDDQVESLIPSQVAQKRDEIKKMLASVIARGGTQIADGLKEGMNELQKGYSKDRINRLLLLTDGKTWDDEELCLRLAEEAGKNGIAITGMGIGDEWNEKLLLQLAEKSGGDSHWIQNPISILDAFKQEVEGVQSVAATNLKVMGRLDRGVKPVRVFSMVPMIANVSSKVLHDTTITADLGSLDGKKGQLLLIEMRFPAQKIGKYRVGQLEVSYDIPAQGISGHKIRVDMSITVSADIAATTKVNAEVMNLVEKVSAFKLQTRALSYAEAGNIAEATRKLEAAATVLLDLGEDELAATAEREILSLKKTGTLTTAGSKKLEYGTRKLTQGWTGAVKK